MFTYVSMCLSVEKITRSKTTDQNFMKFYIVAEHNPGITQIWSDCPWSVQSCCRELGQLI